MEPVQNKGDLAELRSMLEKHVQYTGSAKAAAILKDFSAEIGRFKKIIPENYKNVIAISTRFEEQGMSREDAQVEAFSIVTSGK